MAYKPFEQWAVAEVKKALEGLVAEEGTTANLDYYRGEHWQGGAGWSGPMPDPRTTDVADAAAFTMLIERLFVSQNVVKEVVDRHAQGVTGGGIEWSLVREEAPGAGNSAQGSPGTGAAGARPAPATTRAQGVTAGTTGEAAPATEQAPATDGQPATDAATEEEADPLIAEAEAILASWAEDRNLDGLVTAALARTALVGRGGLRMFVPSGLVSEAGGGVPQADTAAEALNTYVYLESTELDAAGLVTDRRTMRKASVAMWTDEDGQWYELQYRDPAAADPTTVVKTWAPDQTLTEYTLGIGGAFLTFEVEDEVLVTPQVRQNQKGVNFNLMLMDRNNETGGFLERIITNAQPPGKYVQNSDGTKTFIKAPFVTGPGVTNFLQGNTYTDEAGAVTQTSPGIHWRDPVSVDGFVQAKNEHRAAILFECKQGHVLMTGDGSASGEARIQMRADYKTKLTSYVPHAEALLRWALETGLKVGAILSGTPGKYDTLRASVTVTVDDGPATDGERNAAIAAGQAGYLAPSTVMATLGVRDVDGEAERLRLEHGQRTVTLTELAAVGVELQPEQVAALVRRAGLPELNVEELKAGQEAEKQERQLALQARARGAVPQDAPNPEGGDEE